MRREAAARTLPRLLMAREQSGFRQDHSYELKSRASNVFLRQAVLPQNTRGIS